MCIKFTFKSVVQKRTDGYVIESRLVLKTRVFCSMRCACNSQGLRRICWSPKENHLANGSPFRAVNGDGLRVGGCGFNHARQQ